MISYARLGINQTDGIDFDKIVTDAAMREHLGHIIPEKDGTPAKPSKKRTEAPGATAPKKAAKKQKKPKSSSIASLPRRVLPFRATK